MFLSPAPWPLHRLAVALIGLALILGACRAVPLAPSPIPETVSSPPGAVATSETPSPLEPTPKLTEILTSTVVEHPVHPIPLAGPAATDRAEFSGMAWHGDTLVLLPQYPDRFGPDDGLLFTLERSTLEAFRRGEVAGPLTPGTWTLRAPGIRRAIRGFEGFEAIAFLGDRVFLTVEAGPPGGMQGWLLAGRVVQTDQGPTVELDVDGRILLQPRAPLANFSDETLVIAPGETGPELLTVYEANGQAVVDAPLAYRFMPDLTPLSPLPFSHVEYRITDATAADSAGRFWAINYLFPGDTGKLRPRSDPLAARFGVGPSHQTHPHVERLLAFQVTSDGVVLLPEPPFWLALDDEARNWEGVVRFGDGFLLVTDRYPHTILAWTE